MREKILWMRYNFYNRIGGIVAFIGTKCVKLGIYCAKRQKDIYHEATGIRIL